MRQDEIIEQTRKIREDYAAQFDYDLVAIARDLQEKQQSSNRKIVVLEPKKPADLSQTKVS